MNPCVPGDVNLGGVVRSPGGVNDVTVAAVELGGEIVSLFLVGRVRKAKKKKRKWRKRAGEKKKNPQENEENPDSKEGAEI